MYLNQQIALNWSGIQESVFNFLGIFSICYGFVLQLFHIYEVRICLHIYRGMELGQKLEQESIELMIESLIGNQIFLNLHDLTKLPILEILHL